MKSIKPNDKQQILGNKKTTILDFLQRFAKNHMRLEGHK